MTVNIWDLRKRPFYSIMFGESFYQRLHRIDQASYLFPIHISVGQCHGRVVFVHRLTRQTADQVGLRAMRERERAGQLVERLGAHWTLAVELFRLVTLSVRAWSRIFAKFQSHSTTAPVYKSTRPLHPDSNPNHNPHVKGGLIPDLSPECPREMEPVYVFRIRCF